MLKGQHISWALPPESPLELHHQPDVELTSYPSPSPPPTFYNNFVIIFYEIEHSKTQSLLKSGH